MTIKWNWGTGITLVYTGFVVFMLGMVYLCTRQQFDLVTPDYYEQELKYQQVIDGTQNANGLAAQMVVNQMDAVVMVRLPMTEISGKGEIKLYRPDNAALDFSVPYPANGIARLDMHKFKPGMYKVKASWVHDGKPYFSEQSLYIQ